MKRKRQLHNRVEAGKGAVAGPHLLDHDAAVAAAKEVNHAAGQNSLTKPIGGLTDRFALGFYGIENGA